ncbi:phosphatidylinositol-4,5-diphosphate 3-kinase, partial [Reticulomyxa filosa]
LLVEFDEFAFDVIAPKYAPSDIQYNEAAVGTKLKAQDLPTSGKRLLDGITQKNPLETLTVEEKQLVWMSRDLLWQDPTALPAFLRAVNWTSRLHIAEAHKYLRVWRKPLYLADALELLDYRYADTCVRELAVKWLDEMHDSELQQYLLQLVQCLKYENHHDSALSRFLIRRGLKNPYQIGHYLFWHLKAEYHSLEVCERFGLMLEEYLKYAGEPSRQLFIQCMTLKRFEFIAEKIFKAKHTQTPEQCKKLLRKELQKLNRDLPEFMQIPLNPRWKAKKIKVDKCRYMGSKKVPLWIVFENADPSASDIVVLFKSGDDLRQDMLIIQLLSVMDEMWLRSKLDLHLKPYKVIATGVNRKGEGVGMIEIVLGSETVNTINVENGGAFNEKAINCYLLQHSKGENLRKARETFARSCAGYCVATFCSWNW